MDITYCMSSTQQKKILSTQLVKLTVQDAQPMLANISGIMRVFFQSKLRLHHWVWSRLDSNHNLLVFRQTPKPSCQGVKLYFTNAPFYFIKYLFTWQNIVLNFKPWQLNTCCRSIGESLTDVALLGMRPVVGDPGWLPCRVRPSNSVFLERFLSLSFSSVFSFSKASISPCKTS